MKKIQLITWYTFIFSTIIFIGRCRYFDVFTFPCYYIII